MNALVINLEKRQDRMDEFMSQDLTGLTVERVPAIAHSPGWIGCVKSHLLALSSIREFPCLVFEDDCQLSDGWLEALRAGMSQLSEYDAIWLGAKLRHVIPRFSKNLHVADNIVYAHAVLWNTRKPIDIMLRHYEQTPITQDSDPRKENIDQLYAREVQKQCKCYLLDPMVAYQRPSWSDNENRIIDNNELVDKLHRRFAQ